jgi:hypothetical protein
VSTRVAAHAWLPRLRSGNSFGWSRVLEMVERLGSLVATYDNQFLNLTFLRRHLHIKYARECGLAWHLAHVLPAAQPPQAFRPHKAAQLLGEISQTAI